MTRPTNTRTKQRTVVMPVVDPAQLDVTAPMDVAVDTSKAATWAGLSQALGVGINLYAQAKGAADKRAYEDGTAAERLGTVDQERRQKSIRYAEGVEASAAIRQTQAALNALDEERASEAMQGLTVQQKIEELDRRAKQALGPIAADPKLRRIVAPMYADWLEKIAGHETEVNRAQNTADAVAAVEADLIRVIEGAADPHAIIIESLRRLAAVDPGGRTSAGRTITDAMAQYAEENKDETILDILPARITLDDGQTIDSPFLSVRNRERRNQARARILDYKEKRLKPAEGVTWSRSLVDFKRRASEGDLIAIHEFDEAMMNGWITPNEAAGYVERAREQREKNEAEAASLAEIAAFMQERGFKSPRALIGVHPDVDTEQDAQKIADAFGQARLSGLAELAGIEGNLAGEDLGRLAAEPEMQDFVVAVLSDMKQYAMPLTQIKQYMEGMNPAMGQSAVERLPLYELMKSVGEVPRYMDEDTHALFELALQARRAGEGPDQIADTLSRNSDPQFKQWAREQTAKLPARLAKGDMDTLARWWWDTDIVKLTNQPMVEHWLRKSAGFYVARGFPAKQAHEMALERFGQTHTAINLKNGPVVIQNLPDLDPLEVKMALEWFEKGAELSAKEAGDPNPSRARMMVGIGVGGRDQEFYYQGSDLMQLGETLNVNQMIQKAREAAGPQWPQLLEASRSAQEARLRALNNLHNGPYTRAPTAQVRNQP